MSRNTITGTQSRLRIATTTPSDSAPSQLSQPSAYSRFWSRVSPGRARQQMTPVVPENLETAIGPTMALLLVGLVGVGQQAVAVAAVGVVHLPALLQQGEAKIGVLDDGAARPAAGAGNRGAPDQAHGAVHDDGVRLVALDHADVEEAGVFAVHGVVHDRAFAVAVILRRLDHADLLIGEIRHEVLQPVRTHDVVGVDDADDLGVVGGVGEREPQRAGLVAVEVVDVDELEALAQRAAMLLDRLPQRRVGRVVDDHHAFEIRIFEARDRVERELEHVRRLFMGRDMDRHLGRVAVDGNGGRGNETPRAAAESDRRDLLDPSERNQHQRDQQQNSETKRERGAGHEVVPVPEREHDGGPGADHVGCDTKRDRLADGGIRLRQDGQREQQPQQQGQAGDLPVIGIADRTGPREFRVARGVEQTPIGADAALVGLPGLIERLDDVVVDAVGLGARQEIADHQRLLDAAGNGTLVVVAGARPAELGDHDALAGMRVAQPVYG